VTVAKKRAVPILRVLGPPARPTFSGVNGERVEACGFCPLTREAHGAPIHRAHRVAERCSAQIGARGHYLCGARRPRDGGAGAIATCVRAIRERSPEPTSRWVDE